MGVVQVQNVELPLPQELAQAGRGLESHRAPTDGMDEDALSLGALCQGSAFNGEQCGAVTAGLQSPQQQQGLMLSAAPLPSQVDVQRGHGCASLGLGASEPPWTSTPSFRYLRKTYQAAIWAISQPR